MTSIAFAKLLGDNNFVHYMTTESITLGRNSSASDVVLGDNKNISRVHAKISFNSQREPPGFELACLSKNGIFVDAQFMGPSCEPILLKSKALIQIGPRLIYFLLPKADAAVPVVLESVAEGQSTVKGPAGISIHQNGPSAGKKWSRASREKIRYALMRYGFGRWDLVSDSLDDCDYSLANIQVYCCHFVHGLAALLDDAMLVNGLREITDSCPIKGVNPKVPESSLSGWQSMKKNAKKWATRLILLFELKSSIDMFGEESLLDGIGLIKGRALGRKWSRDHDKALCIGTYRHGFGEFTSILNDNQLAFKESFAIKQELPKVSLDEDEVMSFNNAESDHVKKEDEEETTFVAVDPALDATVIEHESTETPVDDGSLAEWPQHLALIGRLKRILDLLRVKRGKSSQSAYGSAVPSAHFSCRKRKEIDEEPEDVATEGLPAKKPRTSMSRTLSPASRKRKTDEKARISGRQMNRKQMLLFQKGLVSQGLPPSWDIFRSAWPGLQSKTDETLQTYFLKFISAVNRVLYTDGEQPCVNATKELFPTSPDNDGIPDPGAITLPLAIRVRDRLALMFRVQSAVKNVDYDALMATMPKKPPTDLPSWWHNNLDMSLLPAVVKYGIGNWDLIWADTTFPFGVSGAKSDIVDNRPLMKRMKFLLSICDPANETVAKVKKPRNTVNSSTPAQTSGTPAKPKMIPLAYDSLGNAVLPFQISQSLTVIKLGLVQSGRGFRDGRHIFPVGFTSEREYTSICDPSRKCSYMQSISSEPDPATGEQRAIFHVVCEDAPEEVFRSEKPTTIWKVIENRIDMLRKTIRKRSSINGLEKFGLKDPLVSSLLEKMLEKLHPEQMAQDNPRMDIDAGDPHTEDVKIDYDLEDDEDDEDALPPATSLRGESQSAVFNDVDSDDSVEDDEDDDDDDDSDEMSDLEEQ